MRLLLIGLLTLVFARADAQPAPQPRAVVWADEALFVFPVEVKAEWSWSCSDTEDHHAEYLWSVSTDGVPGGSGVSFALYKRPGAAPASGLLEELLAAGQVDVTLSSPLEQETRGEDGDRTLTVRQMPDRSLRAYVNVHVERRRDGDGPDYDAVVLSVSGRGPVEALLGHRPDRVFMSAISPDAGPSSTPVHVTYAPQAR